MNQLGFDERFAELTGHQPLSWQRRLYEEWATSNHIREAIALPTGMGKTMVMAIWLIGRENHPDKFPTRLIYVVDRRTVVDQATDLACKLRYNFGEDKLAISTLRGQLADNREWSADPSRPAIIIRTVDLIGSALLFSGYRSSYKRRPLKPVCSGRTRCWCWMRHICPDRSRSSSSPSPLFRNPTTRRCVLFACRRRMANLPAEGRSGSKTRI